MRGRPRLMMVSVERVMDEYSFQCVGVTLSAAHDDDDMYNSR